MMRRLALVAALAIAALLGWTSFSELVRPGVPTAVTNPADYRTFACAARVLAAGHDPYRTEPLRTCEHAGARAFGLTMLDGLVLPAPLPPYALALFEPLALLPFGVQNVLWLWILLLAFAASVVIVAKLSRLHIATVALLLGGVEILIDVPLGQIVPIVVALLCYAALALRAERYSRCAVLCALATMEPHLGLPACVGLFICERRTRPALLASAAVAAGSALAVAGPAVCLEYFRQVLPLHALSQVDQLHIQLSLTSLAYALGADARTAVVIGSASYAAMMVAGVILGSLLSRRLEDRAFIVILPPAFAIVGGVFVHMAQISAAVPALTLLYQNAAPRAFLRRLSLAALVALAIPWPAIADGPPAHLLWPHPAAPRHVVLPVGDDASIAERSYMAFIKGGGNGEPNGSLAAELAVKAPTWFGLLALVGVAIGTAVSRPRAVFAPSARYAS